MQIPSLQNRALWLVLSCSVLVATGLFSVATAEEKGQTPAPKASAKPAAKLVNVRVVPEKVVLSGARGRQGLRVTGRWDDGSVKDVTAECVFKASDDATATVSTKGVITPQKNGAATVTVTVDGFEVTAALEIRNIEDVSYNFRKDVLPVIESLGCNQMGCHGSPKGKKRLALSLFSADPHADYLQIADAKKKLIDPAAPDRSWLLIKAICEEDHGGGDLTAEGEPAYNLLLDWIRNKAPEGSAGDARLERVEVFPKDRKTVPGVTQHLLVEAHYSDGSMRDVTDLAWYRSSETAVAKVDAGVTEVGAYGEATILVRYGGLVSSSRITAAQPAAVPFPDVPAYNRIDELVYTKLRSLNIIPSELCSDEEFLRRLYLDVIGVLPTVDEARAFLADTNPDKRKVLIDELLDRPDYADFYAVKWGDILQINRQQPARLQDKGMWAYYRWLWNALDKNMPMDQFVYETLTARGSAYKSGPANFFRIGEGPQGMAEHASTAFLGVRLDCAHCHNHPFEQFTLVDNLGMAAFFSQVRSKRTLEQDEEVIYLADSGSIRNPNTSGNASPKYLGGAELAAAEKAAAEKAAAEKAAADKEVAQKTAVAKAATNRARADKAASDKLIAAKAQAAKTASDQARAAKNAADKSAAEKQAAEKDVTAAQAAVAKANAEKSAAERVMADATAAVSAAGDNPPADAVAAQKAAAEKVATAVAAIEKANADMATAGEKMAERAAAAQAASDKAATAKANADKTAADMAAARKTAAEKAAVLKAELDRSTAERAAAAKKAARFNIIHTEAIARLTAVETTGDLRSQLVDWIVAPDNPYFARHMSNRIWWWLMGRGIVHQPDDFRTTNPPSNAALLDYLGEQFVESGFDTKAMFRLILNSRTYQASPQPNEWNKADRIHYSHYQLKRLSAEQLAEAINQVTGVPEKYSGLPLGTRATQLPDVSMRSEFLDLFGRPKRATPVESERTCDTHIGQSLQMISSEYLARKLRDNNGLAARVAASGRPASEAIDELYLASLSRLPTDRERGVILAQPIEDAQRREKFEDLLWVLMNTKEFLFNH